MKPFPLAPGKTFLDKLEAQLEGYADMGRSNPFFVHDTSYKAYLHALRYADTRRFLFDAAQAQQFAPLIEFPEKWQDHVREPFPDFYMEFSEPVTLSDAWAVGDYDELRALLYLPARPVRVFTGNNSYENRGCSHLVLFFFDPVQDVYTDRSFAVDIRQGLAYITRYEAERSFEWRNAPDTKTMVERLSQDAVYGAAKEVLDKLIAEGGRGALSAADLASLSAELIPAVAHDRSTGLEQVPEDRQICFIAGDFGEGRNVGWWERQAMAGLNFFRWCLTYMMAKSIKVEIRDISRQQKRWLQRRGKPFPHPWHVVMVDPRYVRSLEESQRDGSHHSYRYDVMGHLRLGRHRIGSKKLDGTYDHRQVLEWVPDHQRGLANEIYIPATRVLKQGRKVPSELRSGGVVGD